MGPAARASAVAGAVGGSGAPPKARLPRARVSIPAAAALVLLLLGAAQQCAHAFLVPSTAPAPPAQQPMLLKAAPSLQARRALLGLQLHAAPTPMLEQEEQELQHKRQQRRPLPLADRRDVLAAGAGIAAAGSWALAAGAAATMAAGAKPATTTDGGAALCDDAISHLRDPKTGKEIYLIGTAHISNASAQLVRTTIRSVRPQTVMLELDEGRVRRVTEAGQPQQQGGQPGQPSPKQDKPGFLKMALSELTRPGTSLRDKLVGVGAVVVGQVISGLYKTLDKMGFVSGQEFLVAMEEAKAVGANILLGDRNVQVTLRRLSEALSQSDLVKIREMESPTRSPAAKELAARGLDVGVGADAKDIAVAVEALKDRASVRKLMGALKQELPAVYQAMIAERDEYMANSLRTCPSKTIVAVVGMGHMDGIERNLGFEVLPCRLGGR